MSTSHAHVNAEIILALSKMGVYMERDRAKLAAMSPSTQNTRLRKAFDRAVENCCIFPLLFDKEQREMGKLSFEGLPDWTGWRTSHKELMSRQSRTMDNFVKALGTHSLWAPFRMGRYSVTESALIQGASVRLKEDVPDMERLLLRWLAFVSLIDGTGATYPGGFWCLGANSSGSAPTSGGAPSMRTACLAIQLLDVFEVQLPDDIDDFDNESGEEDMKKAGYRGNANRRAIPIVVFRYATALPSLGSQKHVKSLIDSAKLQSLDPASAHLTPVELVLFSRLLESNSRRLSPSIVAKYQARAPKEIAKETKISFFSPLYCPGANIADQIEIGRRPRLSCAVCEVEPGSDMKLLFCAACSGVTYCSTEHQSADWPSHKAECRSKTPKAPKGIRANPSDRTSPIVTVVLPLEYHSQSDVSFGLKFVNYNNPAERLKPPPKPYQKPQCARTVYAHGERFLVRARWGGHADRMFDVRESDRRSGNISAAAEKDQDFLNFFMSILHFIDRPMSLSILLQKQTGLSGGMMVLGPNGKLAGDVDNTAIFNAVVNIIKRSEKDKAEAAYFWATRKGDCIEIDVVDLPDQSLGW